ncbi:MAG: GntR family transcriptional regulator [Planctomycetes bacterium]|nr:GntR family transcriptional regulator [Planctomycetota bacterium]
MALDPASPVPLYHQLEALLRKQLEARGWPVGEKLPSEHELCREHRVTRPTVRQALDGLVREGRLVKRRGLGTFVAAPPPPVGLFSLAGTSEVFAAKRLKLTTRVVDQRVVSEAPLQDGEAPRTWVRLVRLRSVNDVPALLERTWVLAAAAPGLESANLNNRSLYQTLEQRFGQRIEAGIQRFSAVAAGREVAEWLKRRRGTPVLRIVRLLDLTSHPGGLRVELFAGEGPFVLEEHVPARGGVQEFVPQRTHTGVHS